MYCAHQQPLQACCTALPTKPEVGKLYPYGAVGRLTNVWERGLGWEGGECSANVSCHYTVIISPPVTPYGCDYTTCGLEGADPQE